MSAKNRLPSLFGSDSRGEDLFGNLHSEIDKVFGQFRTHWPSLAHGLDMPGEMGSVLSPRVNIAETDEAVEVEAELPGFDAKDITVTSQQRTLVIEASRSSSRDEKEKDYHVVERSEGRYRRVVPLGFDIDADSVKASSKDGVLTVTVPKPADIKQSTRKIDVEAA